jgi:hypothetical protein
MEDAAHVQALSRPVGHRQAGALTMTAGSAATCGRTSTAVSSPTSMTPAGAWAIWTLVEGEAADSDDRGCEHCAQRAAGIEEVAAVHDPVLSFRISIVFPMGLLWRRGVYGTNGLTETRLRFLKGTVPFIFAGFPRERSTG